MSIGTTLGISAKVLKHHAKEIGSLKQTTDDATMAHAQAWKDAEEAGVHKAALKFVLKLKKQDAAKATDFQNHFDFYAEVLGLNDQLDMLAQETEREGQAESIAKASASAGNGAANDADKAPAKSKPKTAKKKSKPKPTAESELTRGARA